MEKYAQLYLFDHNGSYYSHHVNIHAKVTYFVWFILGITSPDDGVIGFDKQIYWEGKQWVLNTINDKRIVKTYNLEKWKVYHHRAIRDHGTWYWIPQHQENTFCVNSLVGLIRLTVVMNFPIRNIFLPFFLINFKLSEMHQYFLSVTFFQKFHLLAIPKVIFSICTAPETDLNNESLAQVLTTTTKTQHTS